METPNIHDILARCGDNKLPFKMAETTFFLGREVLITADRPGMAQWRESIFAWMSRNARSAVTFFEIPPNRVIEIGLHVEL
jgi:KUP system potassium uptake protein